jgi:predicted Rossmann fold nucleotide-binding protein DprA/Smf involved in DNA uptake
MYIEAIANQTDIPVMELMEILIKLELQGLIRQSTRNHYIKNL